MKKIILFLILIGGAIICSAQTPIPITPGMTGLDLRNALNSNFDAHADSIRYLDAKTIMADPLFTGITDIERLRVGGIIHPIIDSIAETTGNVLLTYTGADTMYNYIPYANRYELQTALNIRLGTFNVMEFGAKGDGITDDTGAIQAAIDSAISTVSMGYGTGGGVVYFPRGIYITYDTLVITGNYISLEGSGEEAVIRNLGTTATVRFRNAHYFGIENLTLMGSGGAYGLNALNNNAVEIWGSTFGNFDNVRLVYNGGHGFYGLNLCADMYFNNVSISNSREDGMNFVDRTTDLNGGMNGIGIYIDNSAITSCKGDGIEWSSIGLRITNTIIASDSASGIRLGSLYATSVPYDINIVGNNISSNDSSQIKLWTYPLATRYIKDINIENNYIASSGTWGDVSLITQVAYPSSYPNSLINCSIKGNSYSTSGGYVTQYVNLESSSKDVVVDYNSAWGAGKVVTANGSFLSDGNLSPKPFIITPAAVTGITISDIAPVVYFTTGSAIDISANPQIVDGIFDGQEMTIMGSSDINTLTLDDGNGLALSAQFVIGQGDVIKLKYNATLDLWVEISRSNN